MSENKFRPFDYVRYTGDNREIMSYDQKIGEVTASVKNVKHSYVVNFGDASFVISEKHLQRTKPPKGFAIQRKVDE